LLWIRSRRIGYQRRSTVRHSRKPSRARGRNRRCSPRASGSDRRRRGCPAGTDVERKPRISASAEHSHSVHCGKRRSRRPRAARGQGVRRSTGAISTSHSLECGAALAPTLAICGNLAPNPPAAHPAAWPRAVLSCDAAKRYRDIYARHTRGSSRSCVSRGQRAHSCVWTHPHAVRSSGRRYSSGERGQRRNAIWGTRGLLALAWLRD